MDQKYEQQMSTSFYIYWYLHKMLPQLLEICGFCFDGERQKKYRNPFDDKPTFSEMTEHYEEQKQQVDYLLSVK